MNNMKDFRSIADEAMSGVTVRERLKADTLERCLKKRKNMRVILAPAAAFAAVILVGVIALSSPQPGQDGPPNIMMSAGTASPLAAGQEATQKDAEEFFGEAFIMPDYVPGGFSLTGISLTGDEYKQITLTYSDAGGSFVVIEESPNMAGGFEGFETADINGKAGYLRDSENASLPDAEVHWTSGQVHYAVIGGITADEALKVARSMK